jgi:uncharacterized membrane protein (DUF485 family)
MRCKKCGVVLKNEGDLCEKCSKEIQKEKALKADKKEILRIKQKYSPKYILTRKLFEVYIIFILLIFFCAYAKNILGAILCLALLIFIVIAVLAINKKNSKNTYMAFYETKIVFKGKIMLMNVERILSYDDVKDIVFTQGTGWFEKIFQKIFKLGNIYVYPKKGNIISNGMQLEIVENIENVIENVKNVVGDKLK